MAFLMPVMRKEFQPYGTPKNICHKPEPPKPKSKKSLFKFQWTKVVAAAQIGGQGSSKREEERAERLENIRQRRLEKMYTRTRQPSAALRKISEINEDNEAIEQQIVFNARENGFTVLRKLSEEDQDDSGHESEGRSESEIDNDSQLDGKRQHEDKEKNHGKMFNMLRWVAKCSKKQKTPQPVKQ